MPLRVDFHDPEYREHLDDAGFFYSRASDTWVMPSGWQVAEIGYRVDPYADDPFVEAITREAYFATRR